MNDLDKPHFLTVLTQIADYYSKTLSNGVIDLYWHGMRQYDLLAVKRAMWSHTQNPDTGQFMPKIADVTKMIQGTTSDSALIAWAKVDIAVRRVGTYQTIVFDDPIIHRVLSDIGGWCGLGTKLESEWPFIAKEFENRYRGYRMRGEVPEYPSMLQGSIATNNSSQGFKSPDPVLIGNQEKARKVLAGGSNIPMIEISRVSDFTPTVVENKKLSI